MHEQRKSSHQPYGKIDDALDSEMSFSEYFSQRQISKVREAIDAELQADKHERTNH